MERPEIIDLTDGRLGDDVPETRSTEEILLEDSDREHTPPESVCGRAESNILASRLNQILFYLSDLRVAVFHPDDGSVHINRRDFNIRLTRLRTAVTRFAHSVRTVSPHVEGHSPAIPLLLIKHPVD